MGNLLNVFDQRAQAVTLVPPGVQLADAGQRFTYDRRHRVRSVTGVYGSESFRTDGSGELIQKDDLTYEWFLCGSGAGRCLRGRTGTPGGAPVWEAEHSFAGYRLRTESANTSWHYAYDPSGRLKEARHFVNGAADGYVEYGYDDSRRRVRQRVEVGTLPAIETFYPGHGYEVRVDRSQPTVESVSVHIASPSGPLAVHTYPPTLTSQPNVQAPASAMTALSGSTSSGLSVGTLYLHPDLLGSPTLVTNESGMPVARYLYAPFGQVRRSFSAGVDVASSKFTGHEEDPSTGLLYAQARYYDPYSGRFLGPDLVTPGGGLEPMGFNRYAYVLGNPLKFVDPSGESPVLLVGAGVGLAVNAALQAAQLYDGSRSEFSMVELGLSAVAGAVFAGTGGAVAAFGATGQATVAAAGAGLAAKGAMDASQSFADGHVATGAVQLATAGLAAGAAGASGPSLGWQMATANGAAAVAVAPRAAAASVGVASSISLATMAAPAAGGAKRGPKTDPTAPHNATIRAEADALEAGGNTIVAGGGRARERLNSYSRRPQGWASP